MERLISFPPILFSKQPLPDYNSSGDEKCLIRVYPSVASEEYLLVKDYYLSCAALVSDCKTDFLSSAYFQSEKVLIGLVYDEILKELRIIADGRAVYPPRETMKSPSLAPVKLWQFEIDHSLIDCGMCYLFQCSDYSFFVIDSAHHYSVRDDIRIYDFMRERTPADKKVTVAGWFFSHGHDDHIAKFTDVLRYNKDIAIEAVYFNFVPENHYSSDAWGRADKQHVRNFLGQLSLHPEIPVYTLHSGQHFSVRDINFTVMCTHEDVYPQSVEDYNESSTVLMAEVAGNKICFPGDAGPEESEILERRFPSFLKCDVMQMSHHGHRGTSSDFYRLASAETLLIPNTRIKWDEEYPRIEADRVAYAIACHRFIASDGTVELTFPLQSSEIKLFPDECIENFDGIKELWCYTYTDEFKDRILTEFRNQRGSTFRY